MLQAVRSLYCLTALPGLVLANSALQLASGSPGFRIWQVLTAVLTLLGRLRHGKCTWKGLLKGIAQELKHLLDMWHKMDEILFRVTLVLWIVVFTALVLVYHHLAAHWGKLAFSADVANIVCLASSSVYVVYGYSWSLAAVYSSIMFSFVQSNGVTALAALAAKGTTVLKRVVLFSAGLCTSMVGVMAIVVVIVALYRMLSKKQAVARAPRNHCSATASVSPSPPVYTSPAGSRGISCMDSSSRLRSRPARGRTHYDSQGSVYRDDDADDNISRTPYWVDDRSPVANASPLWKSPPARYDDSDDDEEVPSDDYSGDDFEGLNGYDNQQYSPAWPYTPGESEFY